MGGRQGWYIELYRDWYEHHKIRMEIPSCRYNIGTILPIVTAKVGIQKPLPDPDVLHLRSH